MKAPQELNLSPEQGEALIERLEHDRCTPEDRQLLAQVLRLYFWLLFALQESKLSLKRLRAIIFGKPQKPRGKRCATSEEGNNAEDSEPLSSERAA